MPGFRTKLSPKLAARFPDCAEGQGRARELAENPGGGFISPSAQPACMREIMKGDVLSD